MNRLHLNFLAVAFCALAADPANVSNVLELAHKNPAALRPALAMAMTNGDLQKGTAVLSEGPDFLFAIQADAQPTLTIDDHAGPALSELPGDGLHIWYATTHLPVAMTHSFYYTVNGARFGGKTDTPAWPPDAYGKAGVSPGKLTEKRVHTSHIYEGMHSDYWVYTPAGYDAATPAPVMIWQDGEANNDHDGPSHTLSVIDNLTADHRIPVIVHVFISPGLVGEKKMRSIEYDTVDDTYARFLRDEVLVEVAKDYNIRKDGYSRAMVGESSGGICSFNAAWFYPEFVSRVISRIGSFASIQWHPGQLDGGNIYPFKIRKESKRNIRVWLQDGANDIENNFGSWPLQNLQMANSVKLMKYDFHLSFGHGTHTRLGGQVEAPEELTWLWRDYDPSKTDQTYEMEAAELDKPLFRVGIVNR